VVISRSYEPSVVIHSDSLGLIIISVHRPTNSDTHKPASLLLTLRIRSSSEWNDTDAIDRVRVGVHKELSSHAHICTGSPCP
jgi:hypothetical protein